MTLLVVYVIWAIMPSFSVGLLAIVFWMLTIVFLTETDRNGIIGGEDNRPKEIAEYFKKHINKK